MAYSLWQKQEVRLIILALVPYAIGYMLLALLVWSGLYGGAISLTTYEPITIMNRFFPEMS